MQPMVQNNQVLSLAWQNGYVAFNKDSIIFTIFVDKKCEQTPKLKY